MFGLIGQGSQDRYFHFPEFKSGTPIYFTQIIHDIDEMTMDDHFIGYAWKEWNKVHVINKKIMLHIGLKQYCERLYSKELVICIWKYVDKDKIPKLFQKDKYEGVCNPKWTDVENHLYLDNFKNNKLLVKHEWKKVLKNNPQFLKDYAKYSYVFGFVKKTKFTKNLHKDISQYYLNLPDNSAKSYKSYKSYDRRLNNKYNGKIILKKDRDFYF